VKFISLSTKLESLRNTKNSLGSQIKVEEYFSLETKEV
jgi:hypothetical protein